LFGYLIIVGIGMEDRFPVSRFVMQSFIIVFVFVREVIRRYLLPKGSLSKYTQP
jgi:hypothetical protein